VPKRSQTVAVLQAHRGELLAPAPVLFEKEKKGKEKGKGKKID